MKKEIRTKTIEYEVFISDDGTEFDNKQDAIHHDKIINGEIKECPDCKGLGWVLIDIDDEDYHTGAPIVRHDSHRCDTCMGKGYIEKKIKEVWE